jgi:hypothetical protein
MHWGFKALAIVAAFACASPAAAHEPSHKASHHRYAMSVGRMRPGSVYTSRGHYVALIGDPGSGLGFYQLPLQYRIGAWRYRVRNAPPPWEVPPVIAAAQAQAVRYYSWGDPTPASAYHYGVYNPIEGVGTPFFAGYYGPADETDDDSSFPFGHPYAN